MHVVNHVFEQRFDGELNAERGQQFAREPPLGADLHAAVNLGRAVHRERLVRVLDVAELADHRPRAALNQLAHVVELAAVDLRHRALGQPPARAQHRHHLLHADLGLALRLKVSHHRQHAVGLLADAQQRQRPAGSHPTHGEVARHRHRAVADVHLFEAGDVPHLGQVAAEGAAPQRVDHVHLRALFGHRGTGKHAGQQGIAAQAEGALEQVVGIGGAGRRCGAGVYARRRHVGRVERRRASAGVVGGGAQRHAAQPVAGGVAFQQAFECVGRVGRAQRPVDAHHHQPLQRRAQVERPRVLAVAQELHDVGVADLDAHADLHSGVELEHPLAVGAEQRVFRLAGGGQRGVEFWAHRQDVGHVRAPGAKHLAPAGRHAHGTKAVGHQQGEGLPRQGADGLRFVGVDRVGGADDELRARCAVGRHQPPPHGLGGVVGGHHRGPVIAPAAPLGVGQAAHMAHHVNGVGVDANRQRRALVAVARLNTHRQQRNRHVALQRVDHQRGVALGQQRSRGLADVGDQADAVARETTQRDLAAAHFFLQRRNAKVGVAVGECCRVLLARQRHLDPRGVEPALRVGQRAAQAGDRAEVQGHQGHGVSPQVGWLSGVTAATSSRGSRRGTAAATSRGPPPLNWRWPAPGPHRCWPAVRGARGPA